MVDKLKGACKISIIGNSCGGKTKLSLKLSKKLEIPVYHVDSIQYLSDLSVRPYKESIVRLNDIQNHQHWIIDGFGPLDILEKRFKMADLIILIDLPLRRHLFWFLLRQFKIIFKPRAELPDGCREFSFVHFKKVYKNILSVHHNMRPELIRILNRDEFKDKFIAINSLTKLNEFYK